MTDLKLTHYDIDDIIEYLDKLNQIYVLDLTIGYIEIDKIIKLKRKLKLLKEELK